MLRSFSSILFSFCDGQHAFAHHPSAVSVDGLVVTTSSSVGVDAWVVDPKPPHILAFPLSPPKRDHTHPPLAHHTSIIPPQRAQDPAGARELVVVAEPAVDVDAADGRVHALGPHQRHDARHGGGVQVHEFAVVDRDVGLAAGGILRQGGAGDLPGPEEFVVGTFGLAFGLHSASRPAWHPEAH